MQKLYLTTISTVGLEFYFCCWCGVEVITLAQCGGGVLVIQLLLYWLWRKIQIHSKSQEVSVWQLKWLWSVESHLVSFCTFQQAGVVPSPFVWWHSQSFFWNTPFLWLLPTIAKWQSEWNVSNQHTLQITDLHFITC